MIDLPVDTVGTFYYKQKNSQKIRKKYPKNIDGSCCCHNVEEAVFRVQGPYLNIENNDKNQRKYVENQKKKVKNYKWYLLLL